MAGQQNETGEFMSEESPDVVAGNGLLDRRIFLKTGIAGGATLLTARAGGVEREEWMKFPGGQGPFLH